MNPQTNLNPLASAVAQFSTDSGQNGTSATAEGTVINRRLKRLPRQQTVVPEVVRPVGDPAPAAAQPGQEGAKATGGSAAPGASLGEKDVHISISVTVCGKTLRFMEHCPFERTLYEGLRDESRGWFFGALENMLQDVKQAIGIRVNTMAPVRVPDWPEETKSSSNRDCLIKKPIPPYQDYVLPPLHIDPPLGTEPYTH